MDTIKEYIEMCKQAQEIQDQRKIYDQHIHGDWYCFDKGKAECFDTGLQEDRAFVRELEKDFETKVWLPRQDQLQDMLTDHCLGQKYAKFQITFSYDYDYNKMSFEQMWLMTVMRVKYAKVWHIEKKVWINRMKPSIIIPPHLMPNRTSNDLFWILTYVIKALTAAGKHDEAALLEKSILHPQPNETYTDLINKMREQVDFSFE